MNITKLWTPWLSLSMNVKDIKEDKIEFLENQSQRNSIRVDGIPDNDKMVKYKNKSETFLRRKIESWFQTTEQQRATHNRITK